MDQLPSRRALSVDGAVIRYQVWSPPGPIRRGPLVLVHGGAAHQGWWNHIAPLIANERLVVSVDLSGHGDSDWREQYSHHLWAREVLAVAEEVNRDRRPAVLIGHSMGGYVALTAGALAGPTLAGLITIDSPLQQASPEDREARKRRAFRPQRVYPAIDDAVARFRPLPFTDASPYLPYVIRPIAESSVRRHEDGWVWKFDPRLFDRDPMSPGEAGHITCPTALLRGEFGMTDEAGANALRQRLGSHTEVIELPQTGHNMMLDQPLVLVSALRTLLAVWRA